MKIDGLLDTSGPAVQRRDIHLEVEIAGEPGPINDWPADFKLRRIARYASVVHRPARRLNVKPF